MAYGGGYEAIGGFDYSGMAQQQAEMERLRLEQEAQMRAAEDARRQQDEAAKRAQQAQGPRTLGEMVNPQPPANVYDPGQWGQPAEPGRERLPQGSGGPPVDVTAIGQERGTAPPPAGGFQPGADAGAADPGAGGADPAAGGAPPPVNPFVQGATTYYGGTAFPTGTATPGRKTSEIDLDAFNNDIRHSELYQQFTRQRGIGSEGAWGTGRWSDADRNEWRRILQANGVQIPEGMKIDNAGNLNQVNTRNKKLIIGAAIAGGALLTAGALGAFGGAAAGAGGAAGAAGAGAAGAAGAGAAGAAAAGAGTAAAAGGAAAAAGAGASMGASWMPSVIQGIAGLGAAGMGMRAQTRSAEAAARAAESGAASSERLMREQMAFEREQRAAEQAQAQARWEAEQAFLAKQWDASEEERLYQRQRQEAMDARYGSGGGGGFSYSGPDEKTLRKQEARRQLAALLTQGTPGYQGGYVPATSAGPLGRG